ncbi:hypothetical protein PG984_010967 [Apiospora sp. TS-2023a]
MGKGKEKEKDLGEEQDPGQDKDTGKSKSPEKPPKPIAPPALPTAKDLLKLDPKKIKTRDLLRLKPEELTSQEAWQLDPKGRLGTARYRYFELKQVFWKSRRYAPIATVGFGSYGIAVMYGEADTDGKLATRIVIKRALHRKGNESIRRERRFLRTLSRAMHIVQEIPVYVEPEERKKLENPPTLCLEYLQGGTLTSFINDKLPKEKTIPSRLLWSFMLCLILAFAAVTRACIGMVDPPNPPNDKFNPDPPYEPIETAKERYEIGVMRLPLPDMVEQFPGDFATDGWGTTTSYNILHFDIHPSNVYMELADETDPMDMHPFGIRLKLGDFGMADDIHQYHQDRERLVWWKGRGKPETIAPEQGRKKWIPPEDNIAVGPTNNIWGVGCLTQAAAAVKPLSQVMYFLIMKKYPSDATPFTVPLEIADPNTSLSTWGSRLLYDVDAQDAVPDVDMWLRRLVARCLADDPSQRPNHRELVDSCQDAMREMAAPESDRFASAPSETDEAIADFLKWNLYMPSPDVGPALGDPFPPNPFHMPEDFGKDEQAELAEPAEPAEPAGQARNDEQAEDSDDSVL